MQQKLMTRTKRALALTITMIGATFAAASATSSAAPAAADDDEPLRLVQTIKTPTLVQVNHQALDTKRNRLLITVVGSNTLEILDLNTATMLPPLTSLGVPRDALYLEEYDTIVVSSAAHGKLFFFDAETLQPSGTVNVGRNCQYMRYDPQSHEIYVTQGTVGISVIDAEARKVLRTLELGTMMAAFEIESNGDRLFANLINEDQVAVLNRKTGEELARWSIADAGANGNAVMAYDEANQRLFIGCRKPAKFLVLDANTGKAVITPMGMIGDCDTMVWDAAKKCVYATCGSGTFDVFKQDSPDKYSLEARMPTCTGARTSLFVPERRRLYLVCPASRSGDSFIHVYETQPFEANPPEKSQPERSAEKTDAEKPIPELPTPDNSE